MIVLTDCPFTLQWPALLSQVQVITPFVDEKKNWEVGGREALLPYLLAVLAILLHSVAHLSALAQSSHGSDLALVTFLFSLTKLSEEDSYAVLRREAVGQSKDSLDKSPWDTCLLPC